MKTSHFNKMWAATSFAAFLIISMPCFGQNPKLSDPEVAHTAVTANQIDIGYAEIANKKSKNKEILKFAETMTNDHKAVIGQAVALATKLGVTPMDNAVSKQLMSDAANTKKNAPFKIGQRLR
jgi:putative membrane protein